MNKQHPMKIYDLEQRKQDIVSVFGEESQNKYYLTPMEMFEKKIFVRIAAPMVRYSRLPFRMLMRKWGCDLAYTPMTTATEFLGSEFARLDVTSNKYDRPLIVQFAASNSEDFGRASEMVAKYCDGVDLNCGCPQSWVRSEGMGSKLLHNPTLISDMIRSAKAKSGNLPISIKIRLMHDLRLTVEVAKRAEAMGCAFLTVHGRTHDQRSTEAANLDGIKLVKETVSIPVVANGTIWTEKDTIEARKKTGVDGVMSARALLQNPALFAGFDTVPIECIRDWVETAVRFGAPFFFIHNHLMFMLFGVHGRAEKSEFNTLSSVSGIIDWLKDNGLWNENDEEGTKRNLKQEL